MAVLLITLRAIIGDIGDDLVICNQGGNSLDWHHLRPANNFYTQHSMGLTTALARLGEGAATSASGPSRATVGS